jgi:ribose transport system permease protein
VFLSKLKSKLQFFSGGTLKTMHVLGNRRPESISLALCVIMVLLLGTTLPRYFFSSHNISSLITSTSPEGIVALGMMMLLISGVFDLSVGSVMCLGGLVSAMALTAGFGTLQAVLLGLGSGMVIGLLNGIITEMGGVNALITTIGMMYIVRGITEITLVKRGKAGYGDFPESFRQLGQGRFLGIHYMLWMLVIFALVFSVFLARRRGGRSIYYIGNNENAAVALALTKRKSASFCICFPACSRPWPEFLSTRARARRTAIPDRIPTLT